MALRGSSSMKCRSASRCVLPTCWLNQCSSSGRFDRAAGLAHHVGHRRLAPLHRRHADHGHVGHGRMLAQHAFQVAGVDVEAAADDHVLAAVEQDQEAVGVEAADVAGADEALAAGVVPLGLARLLRLAVVADHHAARVAHHLAGLAGRHLMALLVDQADVVALGRSAHGVQLVGKLVRVQDAAAAAFGHAVELHQPAGPALQHIGLQRGVEGRAGAELHVEGLQVVALEVGQRHDALVLHRHQHGVRHAHASRPAPGRPRRRTWPSACTVPP